MASFPNRCQHLKVNGTQCGSPALRRRRFCFFHQRFQDERIKLAADRKRRGTPTFILPVLDDANSIQVALMQVMRALLTRQIDHKTASLLLYALQTASANLRLTDFKPYRHDVILDPRDASATPLDGRPWEDDDFEDDDDSSYVDDEESHKRTEMERRCQDYADKAFAGRTVTTPEQHEAEKRKMEQEKAARPASGTSLIAQHKALMAQLEAAAAPAQKKLPASVNANPPRQEVSKGAS